MHIQCMFFIASQLLSADNNYAGMQLAEQEYLRDQISQISCILLQEDHERAQLHGEKFNSLAV